jgi:hypothetical protein
LNCQEYDKLKLLGKSNAHLLVQFGTRLKILGKRMAKTDLTLLEFGEDEKENEMPIVEAPKFVH